MINHGLNRSSAQSHWFLVYWAFELIFGIWFKHFRLILLRDFDVGLLVMVCCQKRSVSSSPYSTFHPHSYKWCVLILVPQQLAYLIWKSCSNYLEWDFRWWFTIRLKCRSSFLSYTIYMTDAFNQIRWFITWNDRLVHILNSPNI